MSDSFLAATAARQADAFDTSKRPRVESRVFCVSDVHSDHPENLEWCRNLSIGERFKEDTLIVAGDVTPKISQFRQTMRYFTAAFKTVFFTIVRVMKPQTANCFFTPASRRADMVLRFAW